jgi:hypothetical protein
MLNQPAAATTTTGHRCGGEAEGILEADFFVDAMGRSSRLSELVAEQGYERPSRTCRGIRPPLADPALMERAMAANRNAT